MNLTTKPLAFLCLTVGALQCFAANYVLKLDQPTDYVTLKGTYLPPQTGGITLEAWINPAAVDGTRTIVAKSRIYFTPITSAPYTSGTGYALRLADGAVEFALDDNSLRFRSVSLAGTDPIGTNWWRHVAATYDGTVAKVYLDGVLKASQPYVRHVDPKRVGAATDNVQLTPMTIGGELLGQLPGSLVLLTANSHPFLGKIDELRAYARALTPEEIQLDMVTHGGGVPDFRVSFGFDGSISPDATLVGQAHLASGAEAFAPSPTLVPLRFSRSRGFLFSMQAEPDVVYEVQVSTNLPTWKSITTISLNAPSATFTNTSATNAPYFGFLRVKRAP